MCPTLGPEKKPTDGAEGQQPHHIPSAKDLSPKTCWFPLLTRRELYNFKSLTGALAPSVPRYS